MPKTKQQKEQVLKGLKNKIQDSNSLVISTFSNLNVNDDQQLRADLRKDGVQYEVAKKTLLKKAFKDNKMDGLAEDELLGNISVATSKDEVIGAKILSKFAKSRENFKIVGGILNKIWVDANKVAELAKLLTKPELIAKTVYTIKAPLTGFVNVLSGNIRGLVNVLNAIKNK
ncbi:50S ribosomal protein L10 [Candidatus Parcubacteria bacterium]|nr:50S ribosomal protein L10 [Patescibacteria group bacterium]MBU4481912.1 50S ribosomal protein L10 [Patescibacteria group bacterium]MCG2686720.1 50S ribosomal protein L10 [Candidatus Parcubacteria bacterium]